jgi:hypothetical protein
MILMGGHHLILGELVDRITGETLPDTHDERYRQKIAALLLDDKRYLKADIQPRLELLLRADAKKALIGVDFLVTLLEKPAMLIKYGPGSLVTRRRSCIAISRLLTPYQIPVVVITNGEDAEIIDGKSGKMFASGLAGIPARAHLERRLADHVWQKMSLERRQMESRIAFCFEVDGACPCDDTICRM